MARHGPGLRVRPPLITGGRVRGDRLAPELDGDGLPFMVMRCTSRALRSGALRAMDDHIPARELGQVVGIRVYHTVRLRLNGEIG